MKLLTIVALTIVTLVACSSPTVPEEDVWYGGFRFDPPALYEEVWNRVAECTGADDAFADVAWYLVPKKYIRTEPALQVGASHWILNKVAIVAPLIEYEELIAHESVHLQIDGLNEVPDGHPEPYFGECASRWIPRPSGY